MPILTASEAQYGRKESQDQTIAPKYLKILADCEARRIARAAKSAEAEKAALYADYQRYRSALYADYEAGRSALFADYRDKCDALPAINTTGGN